MVLPRLASAIFDHNVKTAIGETEAEVVEALAKEAGSYGGKISMEYNCETGQFYVSSDIVESSEMSIELLARTCFQIENGTIDEYVYQSLNIWSGDDPAKIMFIDAVTKRLEELRETEVGPKKLAVDPSRVFDYRGMKDE